MVLFAEHHCTVSQEFHHNGCEAIDKGECGVRHRMTLVLGRQEETGDCHWTQSGQVRRSRRHTCSDITNTLVGISGETGPVARISVFIE